MKTATHTQNLNRKSWMLALLMSKGSQNKAEAIVGRLRLMKQLFIVSQKIQPKDFYEFVPYLYGPCSFGVYRDLQELKAENLIDVINEFRDGYGTYKISGKGIKRLAEEFKSLDEKAKHELEEIKKTYNQLPIIDLLAKIYKEYPEFASKSMFRIPERLKS